MAQSIGTTVFKRDPALQKCLDELASGDPDLAHVWCEDADGDYWIPVGTRCEVEFCWTGEPSSADLRIWGEAWGRRDYDMLPAGYRERGYILQVMVIVT